MPENNDYTTLLIKTARETGWEIADTSEPGRIIFSSAFHGSAVELHLKSKKEGIPFRFSPPEIRSQVESILGEAFYPVPGMLWHDLNRVRIVLQKASELARSPGVLNPLSIWSAEVEKELKADSEPVSTERFAEVRQRVGQDLYRKALMTLWNGQCAVTGIDIPEILRASHARPWAECEDDRQRLDPYNGFLLSSNLDLLFDSGLITFDNSGKGKLSPRIHPDQAEALGLDGVWVLRKIDPRHREYLEYHRMRVFRHF